MVMSPAERMANALEAASQQDFAAALSDFMWCFDFGAATEPRFDPVRRSFLLHYVARLGKAYPPAVAALRERRDKLMHLLYMHAATAEQAIDFALLNGVLRESSLTLDTYKNIDIAAPSDVRAALFVEAITPLVAARRYEEVSQGPVDLVSRVHERIQQTLMQLDVLAKTDASAARYLTDSIVEEVAIVYEALVGAGRRNEAAIVGDEVVAFDKSSETFGALVKHAIRAADTDLAQKTFRRASQMLPEQEVERLRKSIEPLLGQEIS